MNLKHRKILVNLPQKLFPDPNKPNHHGHITGVSTLVAQIPEQRAEAITELYTEENRWNQVRESARQLVLDEYPSQTGLTSMNNVFEHIDLFESNKTQFHFQRRGNV